MLEPNKLEDLRKKTYYYYSARAADIARQLALVGIAAAWIFRVQQKDGSVAVPKLLVWSMLLLASAVAIDFLRYAWQTGFWGYYCGRLEKSGRTEIDKHPDWVNWPAIVLMWIGFTAVLFGFGFLVAHLIRNVGIS